MTNPAGVSKLHRWGTVWCWKLDVGEVTLKTSLALPDDVAQRATRFVNARDRDAYLAAHRHIQQALSGAMALHDRASPLRMADRWRVDARGKPCLENGPSFNLSRRRTHAALLVSNASSVPVGVDMELADGRDLGGNLQGNLGDDLNALAREHFSPGEIEALARATTNVEKRALFLRVWTRKEAVLKATGLGLSVPTRSFHVGSETTLRRLTLDETTIEVESLDADDNEPWCDALIAVARVIV